jgi:hypothetical protein
MSGQPRTGDHSFAELVETVIGIDNIFRGTLFLCVLGGHVSLSRVSRATTGVHSFGMFRDVRFVSKLTPHFRWRADNDTYEARLQTSVKSNLLYYYHELTWLSALRNIGNSPNHVRDITLPLIRFPLI